jgi:hypothetical protein
MRHGGTKTSAQERADAKFREDTKKRRAFDDARRRVEKRAAVDPSAGIARSFEDRGMSHQDNLVVVLDLVNRDGSVLDYAVCEILESPELTLIVPCPRCIFTNQRPVGESQIKIAFSNRPFHLDTRPRSDGGIAFEPWINPKDPNEIYTQAGYITTDQRCTCPTCGYRFVIDKNRMRED